MQRTPVFPIKRKDESYENRGGEQKAHETKKRLKKRYVVMGFRVHDLDGVRFFSGSLSILVKQNGVDEPIKRDANGRSPSRGLKLLFSTHYHIGDDIEYGNVYHEHVRYQRFDSLWNGRVGNRVVGFWTLFLSSVCLFF